MISKLVHKHQQEKDYDSLFLLLSKQDHIPWLLFNYQTLFEDCGEEKYYQYLRESLVLADYHKPYREDYNDLIWIGDDPHLMMYPEEKEVFNSLPETLTIYRGISTNYVLNENKLNDVIGNSWTLDREVSFKFATQYYQKYGEKKHHYILTYQIPKSLVWSCFNNRNEMEIFLDYNLIDPDEIKIEKV
jgi:hypothetical protein